MTRAARRTLSRLRSALPAALLLAVLAGCGGGGGGGDNAPPAAPAPPPGPPPVSKAQLENASRFATRATFGLPYAELAPLARQGIDDWLTAQFAQPPEYLLPLVDDMVARRDAGEFDDFEEGIEYLVYFYRMAWWHRAVTADDQLRQRVAFALSQIFVVSDSVGRIQFDPYALPSWYDTLLEHSFGNYRDLLRAVTLHPAMGLYLSHVNNARSNPVANTFPDENYAREVMQLFSIGLFELNIDGSVITDSDGQPVPSYSNAEIREFAKIFTGLSYGGDGAFFGKVSPDFRAPMRMFEWAHEAGEKRLLKGRVVPDGQTGLADIESAVDNLFNHPNVGPFIGRQMIQRLVTSNPSPAYVERVARAFNGDTGGVRGDLQATIRAVLTDPEALAPPDRRSSFGMLREPVVRYVAILRQLNATSPDDFIANSGYFVQAQTRQHPLSSPSVFNFFLPTHAPPGAIAAAGLVAPEFQITTSNTVIGFANLVDAALFGDYVTDVPQGFETVSLDLQELIAIAADIEALLERLDLLLTQGTMSSNTHHAIEDLLGPADDATFRVRAALYMTLISPDFAAQY